MISSCQKVIYPVVYITDDNYAMPTAVSVTSLYYSKEETERYDYHVYIICDKVSPDNLKRLKSLSKKDLEVTIIEENGTRFSGITAAGVEHVSSTALHKFELPNIFSQYDKILYLDGDTLVTKDLFELFETDIEGRYAAVVKDYRANQYNPSQLAKLKIDHKHGFYWNSGMMLLNLRKLREDNITEKLFEYRANGINFFMDQDALNVVLEENVKYVSLYYNAMSSVLEYIDSAAVAEYYNINEYENFTQAISWAAVLHLTGQYKPWEHLVPFLSDVYSFYHSKSPYSDIPLRLLDNDELDHHATDSVIPVIYSIDNSSAKYAGVSVASIIHNKRSETKYDIVFICHGVDPTRIARFKAIAAENVKITIICPDYSSENFFDQYGNVEKTSLISRIRLPELLPKYDKVIFISPTTMVSKDLTDFFCQDLEGFAAGAVPDFRQQFKGYPLRLNIKNRSYYNTDVVLYNLKYFRENNCLSTEILHYIKYGMNRFKYQDAFNVCAGEKTRLLSYYFNALDNVFDLYRKPLDTAKMLGVKRFSGQTELFSRAYVVNFSCALKPWKDICPVFSDAYLRYYLRSVFCDYSLGSTLDTEVEKIENDPNYILGFERQTEDIFYNKMVWEFTIPKGEYKKYVYKPSEEWSEHSVYSRYGNVTPDGLNKQPREKKIVVSLTTIPFRIEAASLVIAIMMHQTMKPDEIVINLGSEFFKDVKLPALLLDEERCGVKINYCRDLFCHTKYFHTVQEYPDDIVITVDDDILYAETLIEDLYNSYLKYPDCISSMRTHLITFDNNNHVAPYINWKYECTDYIGTPSHRLFATGVGGVLYPPHSLPAETFNIDSLLEVCPKADDIWLKIMEVISDVKVVTAKRTDPLTFIGETQNVGLCYENVHGGGNDEHFFRTLERYNRIDESSTVMNRLLSPDDEIRTYNSLARQFDMLTIRARKAEEELVQMQKRALDAEQSAEEAIVRFRGISGKANYLQRENELIRVSFSFRIGRLITWLPRKIIGFLTHNKNR